LRTSPNPSAPTNLSFRFIPLQDYNRQTQDRGRLRTTDCGPPIADQSESLCSDQLKFQIYPTTRLQPSDPGSWPIADHRLRTISNPSAPTNLSSQSYPTVRLQPSDPELWPNADQCKFLGTDPCKLSPSG